MPGVLKLNIKEANALADEIERGGGNSDGLRAAIEEVNNPGNSHYAVPVSGSLGDEEYLEEMRSKSSIERGTDLECQICHEKFDHLVSGTCEVCFREWMLPLKPKPGR